MAPAQWKRCATQLLQHFPLHQPHFPLIGNAESRIQADFVKMVPQQEQAEAVDGSDLGIMQKRGLFLNMLGVLPLGKTLRYPASEPC